MKTMESRFSRPCDNFCQTRRVDLDLRLRTDSVAGTILRAVPNVDSPRRKNDGISGDACYKTEYINRPGDELSIELGRQKLSRARIGVYPVCDWKIKKKQAKIRKRWMSLFPVSSPKCVKTSSSPFCERLGSRPGPSFCALNCSGFYDTGLANWPKRACN